MWGYHNGMGWWMVIDSLWFIMFWAVIIGLVVWGVRAATGKSQRRDDMGETPLEIAKRRLARGEITKERFEELEKVLS